MAKKKLAKSKKSSVRVKKSYNLIEGNSNEFLLIVGAVSFLILSVLYLSF